MVFPGLASRTFERAHSSTHAHDVHAHGHGRHEGRDQRHLVFVQDEASLRQAPKKREVGQSISESPTIHVAGPHRKHLKMHKRPMVMDNIPTLNELEPT